MHWLTAVLLAIIVALLAWIVWLCKTLMRVIAFHDELDQNRR